MTNQELIQKAVITTDAIAATGKLNPAQSDKFIDYIIDVSGLKNNARTVRFRNESLNIDKIGVGRRVAMPKREASAVSARRGINTSQITLTPQELVVPFEIGDNFREVNLEGDAIEDHIIRMMASSLANNIEELYIGGDTLGVAVIENEIVENGSTTQYIKDTYLAMTNGWLRQADAAHNVDIGAANVGINAFSRMLNAMPAKFKRNRSELRFITSLDLEQNYRERTSSRVGITGETALNSNTALTPFGVPLMPFPLYPFRYREVEHLALSGNPGTAIALRRKNVTNVVVLPSTLTASLTTPYVENTDYVVDYQNGTVARVQGGALADPTTVKITYDAPPNMILTHYNNLIVAIGRDIRIEKDRDIYKGVNQYAITAKVDCKFEEVDAIVKANNFGIG